MSQFETHVGKLEKINKDINKTVEEWCKDFFAEKNINQLNSQVILNEPIYNINTLVDELIDNCFEIHSGNYSSDRCLELDDVLEILNKYFNLEEE